MRIRQVASVVSLLCLAATACTTTSQGEPMPASTSEVSTTDSTASPSEDEGDLPSHGAPKVEDPLDTTRFQQKPCSTLTAAQAQELALPANGQAEEESGIGIGCEWSDPDTRGQVTIVFVTSNPDGLSAVYAANERDRYAHFTPLSIEGFPAVADDVVDRRPMGGCIVNVGVTDQLIVNVSRRLPPANLGEQEPCEAAAQAARMALRTMKEGA